MTHANDPHAPTDEFVEFLERDTMRRLRYEQRFATSDARPTGTRRMPSALMLVAGVLMTLTTGMVLGASANYASAEVLPNGTTTIPARPALAIFPIKNALSAIGCTQAPQGAAVAKERAASAVVADTESVTNQVAVPAMQAQPDRAAIAALATRHQAAVVRGDSAADYVVMVLDASEKYVWSTHGNGGVSIEVGADHRTAAERREYARTHSKELIGNASLPFSYETHAFISADSTRHNYVEFVRGYTFSRFGDSTALDSLGRPMRAYIYGRLNSSRGADSASGAARRGGGAGGGAGGAVGRGRGQSDSLARRYMLNYLHTDSLVYRDVIAGGNYAWSRQGLGGCARNVTVRAKRIELVVADSASGPYTVGLPLARLDGACNEGAGLQQPTAGESGIAGLASGNVTSADVYVFPAGELGSKALQVMVVHLTAGTKWTGR